MFHRPLCKDQPSRMKGWGNGSDEALGPADKKGLRDSEVEKEKSYFSPPQIRIQHGYLEGSWQQGTAKNNLLCAWQLRNMRGACSTVTAPLLSGWQWPHGTWSRRMCSELLPVFPSLGTNQTTGEIGGMAKVL